MAVSHCFGWPQTSEAGALVQEARQLAKCQRIGVPAPVVYAVDLQRNVIYMECIDGDPVKAWLRAAPLPEGAATSAAALGPAHLALARAIGRNVARLHDHQIVHGDLTTSNMLVLRGTEGTLAPTVVGLAPFIAKPLLGSAIAVTRPAARPPGCTMACR